MSPFLEEHSAFTLWILTFAVLGVICALINELRYHLEKRFK